METTNSKILVLFLLLLMIPILSACQTSSSGQNGRLNVVATTNIVGDVVKNIGGDAITLNILLSPGVDPHSFDPSPKDIAAIADADIVFANGAGLEIFLDQLIANADAQDKVVYVSDGIDLRESPFTSELVDPEHSGADPHTWTDPNNVLIWVDNIKNSLTVKDPTHAAMFETNSQAYKAILVDLDTWIKGQIELIPQANREIVTDHQLFGYFADRYGLKLVGAVIPSYSTSAEASASDLADLENAIVALQAKSIFVGNTINPSLAEQISRDTGISLNFIYTGSLSDSNGDASTYVDYIKYNVNTFVSALR